MPGASSEIQLQVSDSPTSPPKKQLPRQPSRQPTAQPAALQNEFPIKVEVLEENEGRKSNLVKTAQYTWITFLPFKLVELIRPDKRFANFYFLVVGVLQGIPAISVTYATGTWDWTAAAVWQTLVIIIFVDLILSGKEERQRRLSDRKTNSQQVAVLPVGGGPMAKTTWADVTVGSVVKVYAREHFPADLLLLRGSDPPGQCWANTKPLDGETDTKLRLAPKGVANLLATLGEADVAVAEGVRSTTSPYVNKMRELLKGAYVVCEAPNDKALGLVVSTGTDAKINFKGPGAKSDKIKTGSLMLTLNKDIGGVVILLFTICLAACIIGGFVNTFSDFGDTWYMGSSDSPWNMDQADSMRPDGGDASFVNWIIITMTYFLLCYQFIPISLYVSLSIVQMLTRGFVIQDLTMYDEEGDEPCQVRSMSLLDELGQVSHIFSDKTGTLTSNLMSFRRCYLNGVEYGVGETAIAKSLRAMAEPKDQSPPVKLSTRPLPSYAGCTAKSKRFVGYDEAEGAPSLFDALEGDTPEAQRHREFMLHQAINHSVLIEKVGGKEELCASSPDEQAFVGAAEYFGYEFTERRSDVGELMIKDKRTGEDHMVQILEVFPYESSRKRMSIIVRLPPALVAATGGGCAERLYCKGADSVVLERLDRSDALSSPEVTKKMEDLLYTWAEVALRTLVWAQKEMKDFDDWHKRYRKAAETPSEVAKFKAGEPSLIGELQEEAEGNLQLQGATAIEDKLQDGVPEVLADLRTAGIKVWMLTGDKVGTAKNIATACNILPASADVLELTSETHAILGELKIADLLAAQKTILSATPRRMSTGGRASGGTSGSANTLAVEAAVRELDSKYPGLREVRDALSARVQAMTTSTADHCFVLDEKAIEYLGLVCGEALTLVGNGSRSVVACRARKDQKAQMLELIRYGVPGSCCLAIGDGANDVAMIKAGNIGVGIIGKEGMEAVNNSDFAIGQFRFLRGLLLVHGRMCYRRMANVACYMFFKNIANVCALYFYAYLAASSAVQVMPLFFVTWWNVFFSSMPVLIYGFGDQDVSKDVSAEVVELYGKGLRREFYNHTVFARWIAEAFYFGILCSYVPTAAMLWPGSGDSSENGRPVGIAIIGFAIACNITVTVNLRFALEQHSWGWIELIMIAGTFLMLELFALDILTCFQFQSTTYQNYAATNGDAFPMAYEHPAYWLNLILVLLLALGPRLAIKGYHGVVGTPAKNAMLVRARRRADRQTYSQQDMPDGPDGRQLSRRNTGHAFSVNEPTIMHLHASTSNLGFGSIMRDSTPPGATPVEDASTAPSHKSSI